MSGVMATIAAGLTIGGWGRMRSYAVRDFLEHFGEYVAFLANALIFLMVGLRVELGALWATLGCWAGWSWQCWYRAPRSSMDLCPSCNACRELSQSIAYKAVIFWGCAVPLPWPWS